jgi:1,4-dihydroxy-2-naphthoate octaprenyltransferase
MKTPILSILGLFQPFQMLQAGLVYFLGLGIAQYLGISLNTPRFLLGFLFMLGLVAAGSALTAYFSPSYMFPRNLESPKERDSVLRILFYSAVGLLSVVSITVFYLLLQVPAQLVVFLLAAISVSIAVVVSVPPMRLMDRGFGEIAQAILIGGLPALFAFALQAGTIHRLVSYLSLPIILLSLACLLALEFPVYGIDLKYNRQSMLIRLTWQKAITVHNILMASAYIFLLAAPLMGIPLKLSWAPLLTLPLAIYQAIILRNIELGLKPNWRIWTLNAYAIAGLAAYLLAFTFWIR